MTPPYGAAATAAARTTTSARTRPARPGRPARRVSGPAAPPRPRPRAVPRAPRAVPRTRGARAVEALRRVPDSRLLDRALRGRAWIGVLAVALMGIVAMQVSMLRMNAGIGHAVQTASALERQNSDLRAEVSALSAGDRIAREAEQLGYVMPPAGSVRYVHARPPAGTQKGR